MELRVRVRSSSEARLAVEKAARSGARKLVLEVVARDPAEAAEVVRGALSDALPFTVEVRVAKDV